MSTSPWSYAIDLAVVVGTFALIGLGKLDWSHGLPLVTAIVGGQLMMRRPPPPPPPAAPSASAPTLPPAAPSSSGGLARVVAGSVLATVLFAVLFLPLARLNHLLEHGFPTHH